MLIICINHYINLKDKKNTTDLLLLYREDLDDYIDFQK